MGTVLGDIPGLKLIHFAAVWMLSTILLCYTIAVKEGHVPIWLPMISACGDTPPEQYIFRFGILTGALLLVVLALFIYTADFPFSHDSTNVFLGVFGGLCLGVVAICADNEDNAFHTTCAVIYFVMEDLVMLRITMQGYSTQTGTSSTVKAACTAMACLSTTGRFLVMAHYIPAVAYVSSGLSFPFLAIFEWANTLAIIAFHWSFAFDFRGYAIASWKDSGTLAEQRAVEGETKVALL